MQKFNIRIVKRAGAVESAPLFTVGEIVKVGTLSNPAIRIPARVERFEQKESTTGVVCEVIIQDCGGLMREAMIADLEKATPEYQQKNADWF